jgi:hypothetical protein
MANGAAPAPEARIGELAMKRDAGFKAAWWLVWCVFGVLAFLDLTSAQATPPAADGLRAQYVSMQPRLAASAFRRPLVLESQQLSGALKGDVSAVIDHPFRAVQSAVGESGNWCDIMILHLNVKQCSVTSSAQGDVITTAIGRKSAATAEGAHRLAMRYRVTARSADYLRVELAADSGPMGTSDYQVVLEALPLDGGRTFLHFSYGYTYGASASLAMRTYFNTVGSDKVGFTVVDRRADGEPVYVGDVRGALERNTMRYFLAIEAYLNASSAPADRRVERRAALWYAATERYAPQLHELERAEYMAQKLAEVERVASGR